MIFVTVGTHEQQFNRLVEAVDNLDIDEPIFIQTGYSTYNPVKCEFSSMITAQEMKLKMEQARIVITHGGPGSIMSPLQLNKVPIVVPRQYKFDEHVNDHQVNFTKRLESEKKVIAIYDIEDLAEVITCYEELSNTYRSMSDNNTNHFVSNLQKIIDKMMIGEE